VDLRVSACKPRKVLDDTHTLLLDSKVEHVEAAIDLKTRQVLKWDIQTIEGRYVIICDRED